MGRQMDEVQIAVDVMLQAWECDRHGRSLQPFCPVSSQDSNHMFLQTYEAYIQKENDLGSYLDCAHHTYTS